MFLSWRLLGPEVTGHTDDGMTGPDVNGYRGDELIATVSDSTNHHLDEDGDGTATYRVAATVDDVEVDVSDEVTPWSDGVTPAAEHYT